MGETLRRIAVPSMPTIQTRTPEYGLSRPAFLVFRVSILKVYTVCGGAATLLPTCVDPNIPFA